jgi:acyl carrier protein
VDTLRTITELAATQFGMPLDRVNPDTPVDQLGIDSLDFLEFLFKIEDHYGITIPPESVVGVRSLSALAPVVDARLAASTTTSA